MKRVRLAAGLAPYDVIIGRGALEASRLRPCLGKTPSGIVVTSTKVARLHGPALRMALGEAGFEVRRELKLPDGEAAKTPRVWERIVSAMARAGLDRSSFVVAFGGGSIGDAAGFAAATYMRGIRLIQIPTTLLSMVDSSVGGKTGVNLAEGKNLVGSFHQPTLVLGDLGLLGSLPAREGQSGVYEVLKCGLLRNEALVTLVEGTRGLRKATEEDLEAAIAAAVRIKARIVERDEREGGERVLLNLGHTLGHALEAATAYRLFTHGEAVGYGLEFAVAMSERLGLAPPAATARMRSAIRSVGTKTPLPRGVARLVRTAVFSDKKRVGSELTEVLLKGPGRSVVLRIEAREYAAEAERWLLERAGRNL